MARGTLTGAEAIDAEDQAWLTVFEAVGVAVREATAALLGTEAGRVVIGVGAGGDRTVELDRAAEEVALDELRRFADAGHPCSVLSEEAGVVDMGAPWPLVILDPVDGSVNAKQGLPLTAVMLSLATGPTVGDVRVGWTLNLVSGERWYAVRGAGAYRDGRLLSPLPPAGRPGRIDVLGFESPARDLHVLRPLFERTSKVRVLGSMALLVAHGAAGGIEVFAVPFEARIFDMTAGMLMLDEVGGVVTDLEGRPLRDAAVGLDSRTTLLGSAHPGLHRLALDALRG
jgi:myo-inositol-1(or 4)-monophosphatase